MTLTPQVVQTEKPLSAPVCQPHLIRLFQVAALESSIDNGPFPLFPGLLILLSSPSTTYLGLFCTLIVCAKQAEFM
jgi:hypothetical protein